MRNNKYRKLRRNPLVRLMRWVYKFFKKLFSPQRSAFKSVDYHRNLNNTPDNLDLLPVTEVVVEVENPFPTVGELLEKIQWQLAPGESTGQTAGLKSRKSVAQTTNSKRSVLASSTGTSKNQFLTVGELLGQVRWQLAPVNIQGKTLDLSKVSQPQDVSRN
jgi:hypothetical protein